MILIKRKLWDRDKKNCPCRSSTGWCLNLNHGKDGRCEESHYSSWGSSYNRQVDTLNNKLYVECPLSQLSVNQFSKLSIQGLIDKLNNNIKNSQSTIAKWTCKVMYLEKQLVKLNE